MTKPTSDCPIEVRFEGLSTAAANTAAEELRRHLDQATSGTASFKIKNDRTDTQDFGATLVIVLGTPAVLAIAKGIHDFIAKRGNRVTIMTPNGKIVATGDASHNIDVAKTVEALSQVTDA